MMILDHVGDLGAMVHAQLGQQLHVRTTETSLQRSSGNLFLFERAASCSRFLDRDTAQGGGHVPEHCPVSILQAHGGDAIARVAGWTIERFVAITALLAVEQP